MREKRLIKKLQNPSSKEYNSAILWIEDNWFQDALRVMKSIGVERHLAEEIFWESLTNLYQSVKEKKFEGKGTLKSYLLGICRYKSLDRLKREGKSIISYVAELPVDEYTRKKEDDDIIISEEIVELFYEILNKLDEKCKKVLTLAVQGYSMAKIAKSFKFDRNQSAATLNYRCRNKLREMVESDQFILNKLKKLL